MATTQANSDANTETAGESAYKTKWHEVVARAAGGEEFASEFLGIQCALAGRTREQFARDVALLKDRMQKAADRSEAFKLRESLPELRKNQEKVESKFREWEQRYAKEREARLEKVRSAKHAADSASKKADRLERNALESLNATCDAELNLREKELIRARESKKPGIMTRVRGYKRRGEELARATKSEDEQLSLIREAKLDPMNLRLTD